MNARALLIATLAAASFGCKQESAELSAPSARLPIVVYYSLPG